VDPYVIYFDPDGATLKLLGYDHIRSLQITGAKFERQPNFDLREFLAANCFNGIHGEPITVKLRARRLTARIFAERTFHRSQRVLERKRRTPRILEESITIEMRVARGRGLVRFILSWGDAVEVLHPPELRREIQQTYRQALAAYKSSSSRFFND
jgi:predicted DNA-binding transcriptional regulator YafY